MVRLAVGMAKYIRGLVHVQTNPYYSYSSEKTVVNALRMLTSIPTTDIIPNGADVDNRDRAAISAC